MREWLDAILLLSQTRISQALHPGPGGGGLCTAVSPHRFELVSPGVDRRRGVGGYLLYRWPQFLAVRTMEVTKLPKATTRAPRRNFHATPWNTKWQNRQSTTQSFSGYIDQKQHGGRSMLLLLLLLTGGSFLEGMRNGVMFSPSSCMALVLTSLTGLPPDCLWTSLDSSTWIACWAERHNYK